MKIIKNVAALMLCLVTLSLFFTRAFADGVRSDEAVTAALDASDNKKKTGLSVTAEEAVLYETATKTIIFRKNANQITSEGGLWDTASTIYPYAKGKPSLNPRPTWRFPSGAKITFAHLEYEGDKNKWQGSQIAYIGFDELTHFSESQFFYMLSRNRSVCGVKPYMRATTNPDVDSWVARFIDWWINPDTGYPIPERSGVIRWLGRYKGLIYRKGLSSR